MATLAHMPNTVSNELTINGSEEEIQKFITENYKENKWDIPQNGIVNFNNSGNSCCLQFETDWFPPRKWLKEVRAKFTNLKFSLYWTDIDDPPICGLIESDGQECSIEEPEDLKLACKLLSLHRQKENPVSVPVIVFQLKEPQY